MSAIGVEVFYLPIPKMGVGAKMSMALTGQVMTSVIASHFSWFGLPASPISPAKFVGVISIILGTVVINR